MVKATSLAWRYSLYAVAKEVAVRFALLSASRHRSERDKQRVTCISLDTMENKL